MSKVALNKEKYWSKKRKNCRCWNVCTGHHYTIHTQMEDLVIFHRYEGLIVVKSWQPPKEEHSEVEAVMWWDSHQNRKIEQQSLLAGEEKGIRGGLTRMKASCLLQLPATPTAAITARSWSRHPCSVLVAQGWAEHSMLAQELCLPQLGSPFLLPACPFPAEEPELRAEVLWSTVLLPVLPLTSPHLFLASASFPLPSSAANRDIWGKREVERAHLD